MLVSPFVSSIGLAAGGETGAGSGGVCGRKNLRHQASPISVLVSRLFLTPQGQPGYMFFLDTKAIPAKHEADRLVRKILTYKTHPQKRQKCEKEGKEKG